MTFDPNFKVTTFFEVEYRKNGASWRQSYYCAMGNYTKHMEWYYVGDLDWPTSASPARLPAQLNASHAHQSARFTACSTSRRPAGSLRQAVLLNAAPAGNLAGALKLNAPQPRPLASGEGAAANRRCWSSYNSCQWVSDMVTFGWHVAGCIIVDVSAVRLLFVLFS